LQSILAEHRNKGTARVSLDVVGVGPGFELWITDAATFSTSINSTVEVVSFGVV
jgi:hypothetical protein